MEWNEETQVKDGKTGAVGKGEIQEAEPYIPSESIMELTIGVTADLGDYQSARISEGLSINTCWKDRNELFRQACEFLQERAKFALKSERGEKPSSDDLPLFEYECDTPSAEAQRKYKRQVVVAYGRTAKAGSKYEAVRIDLKWKRWITTTEPKKVSDHSDKIGEWLRLAVGLFLETQAIL